jgi:hypothetical protein
LAATQTLLPEQIENKQPQERFDAIPLLLTAALTLVAILVHGYHPYAEDGGIYLPGIFKLIHPELYPTWTGFVTAQTRFSLFAPSVAEIVRLTGINVMLCVFGAYVLSIWGTLYAAWQIAARCLNNREARYGAVAMLALCMTMPAAGTSLLLVDPYVTARSISTPLGLLAIVGALDIISAFKGSGRIRIGALSWCAASLLVAAAMHPLMASYTAGCVILLLCASISSVLFRMIGLGAVATFSAILAMVVNLLAPPPPHGYAAVALSRYYWFLSAWRWYEIAGLIAPLLLLWALTLNTTILNDRGRSMAYMGVFAGLIGLEVSLLFAHQSAHNYFVAMLQPLRIFHMVYIVMLLLVGAMLAGFYLERDPVRWTATFLVLGSLMFFVQLQTFPHSSHIELPWRAPTNDWERGFAWIRNNTPINATFALDANYIDSPREDAQSFRAVAERSAVPDYTKDGGIAAIDPTLTPEWMIGESIQAGLAKLSDPLRRTKLTQAHIEWLVLPSASATLFDCPYQNPTMKVCRIAQH